MLLIFYLFLNDLSAIITKNLVQKLIFDRETGDLCIPLKCVYVENGKKKENAGFAGASVPQRKN